MFLEIYSLNIGYSSSDTAQAQKPVQCIRHFITASLSPFI